MKKIMVLGLVGILTLLIAYGWMAISKLTFKLKVTCDKESNQTNKAMVNSDESILNLTPTIGDIPDFSIKAQDEIVLLRLLFDKGKKRTSQEDKELKRLRSKYGGRETIWEVLPANDCSWYCGGGMYKVETSSMLNTNFEGRNANDLDFKTAWITGGQKQGIGEYITYYFKNEGPQIKVINVYNGIVENDESWKDYSRVKQLKLFINNKPFAILNLEDTKSNQSFKIPLLGNKNEGKELMLRFEIMSIYLGSKYHNAALTEIYYAGISH